MSQVLKEALASQGIVLNDDQATVVAVKLADNLKETLTSELKSVADLFGSFKFDVSKLPAAITIVKAIVADVTAGGIGGYLDAVKQIKALVALFSTSGTDVAVA